MAKKKNINVEEETTVKKVKGSKSKKTSNNQKEEAQQVIETAVIDPLITIEGIEDVESETVTTTTLVLDETPLKIIEEKEEQVVEEPKNTVEPRKVVIKAEPKKVKVAVKNKPKNRKINSVFGDFTYNWNGQSIEY